MNGHKQSAILASNNGKNDCQSSNENKQMGKSKVNSPRPIICLLIADHKSAQESLVPVFWLRRILLQVA